MVLLCVFVFAGRPERAVRSDTDVDPRGRSSLELSIP